MAEWIKLAATDITYTLGASEFGGMTVLPDGSASFSDFNASMSEYLWRVFGISGYSFVPALPIRIVFTHSAGSFTGEARIEIYDGVNDPSMFFVWGSGAGNFTKEFEISSGKNFQLFTTGDFVGFTGVFEIYAFLDGGGTGDACFWSHDSMVGVTEECAP